MAGFILSVSGLLVNSFAVTIEGQKNRYFKINLVFVLYLTEINVTIILILQKRCVYGARFDIMTKAL